MSKLFMEGRDLLIALSIKHAGDFDKMYADVKNKVHMSEEEVKALTSQNKRECITILDDNYPEMLKSTHNPPLVLYVDYSRAVGGNFLSSALERLSDCIRIAFSGNSKEQNVDAENVFMNGNTHTIITNDGGGYNGNIREGTRCDKLVVVAGQGLDTSLQSANCNALFLSEYPDGTLPSPERYEARNRIIAGLCTHLVVEDPMVKSSMKKLIDLCFIFGKPVYLYTPNKVFRDEQYVSKLSAPNILNITEIN